MSDKQKVFILIAAALFVIAVVIVLVIGRGETSTSEVAVIPTTEMSMQSATPEKTVVAVEETDGDQPETITDEMASEVEVPPAKTELSGTDPATVNLASGDIQLIEVFAFW
jgi:hypothetical protein